jgi:hypothetical protein
VTGTQIVRVIISLMGKELKMTAGHTSQFDERTTISSNLGTIIVESRGVNAKLGGFKRTLAGAASEETISPN